MENSLQLIAEYRLNFVLSFVYTLVPLVSFVFLWMAVYISQSQMPVATTIGGYTLSDMITYYLLATWVGELNATDRNMWVLSEDIRTGRLSLFLLLPLDYLSSRFFRSLAITLPYSLVGAGLITGFAVSLGIPLVYPDSLVIFLLSVISFMMGHLLASVIGFLRGLSAFWLESTGGLNQLLDWLFMLISGSLIPLTILPSSLQHLSLWLPFQYLIFFPVHVFLGQVPLQEVLHGLAIEVGWCIALFVALRLVWLHGLRRYTAVGG